MLHACQHCMHAAQKLLGCQTRLSCHAEGEHDLCRCLGLQRNRFHGRWQYLFIESICNDQDVLAQNYRYKMMYSPDYKTQDADTVSTPAEREYKVE